MWDNNPNGLSKQDKDEVIPEPVSKASSRRNSSDEQTAGDLTLNKESDDSSDDDNRKAVNRSNKRVQRFTDSEDESEISNVQNNDNSRNERKSPQPKEDVSDVSSDTSIFKSVPQKSRIRKVSTSGSDSDLHNDKAQKNEEQQSRMINKNNKLKQKFKGLINSRKDDHQMEKKNEENSSESLNTSDDEASSIERIRQKIKERTMTLKSTIYDPDTSDEERSLPTLRVVQKQKKGRKSTILTSPKPVRMSAKQAMENMQKIKSESNRMLREKEVTLPYHRPKALTLKDIMSRRRPAVAADGKALPIKMNEEQLRQYALSLEQRQKEMMELCKSDTDDEDLEDKNESKDISSLNDTTYDELVATNDGENNTSNNEDNAKNNDISNPVVTVSDTNVVSNTDNEKDEGSSNTADIVNSNGLKNNISVENMEDEVLEKNKSTEIELVYNDSVEDIQPDDVQKTTGFENSVLEENKDVQKATLENSAIDEHKKLQKATGLENSALEENKNDNGDVCTEMELVHNESIDGTKIADATEKVSTIVENVSERLSSSEQVEKIGTEESQLISLYFDTEPVDKNTEKVESENVINVMCPEPTTVGTEEAVANKDETLNVNDDFSDDDVNMMDIDALIENAEIIGNQTNGDVSSPMLIRDPQPLRMKPKLTGSPGMIIDLDGGDAFKKVTGVELLKQRFTYFAKLMTPGELERSKEKKIKPGTQHLKLKQELEEKIAEQRSLEWAKRLEDEKQQQKELDAIRGETSDGEEDIDKIEAKLNENDDAVEEESSSESEEEEIVEEKPRKLNPMIADEAEESDCDEVPCDEVAEDGNDADDDDEEVAEESDESSESEDEQQSVKKGRILKAFEDSDDEDVTAKVQESAVSKENNENNGTVVTAENNIDVAVIKDTQDDEIQLAQLHKSFSEDLFTSQESGLLLSSQNPKDNVNTSDDKELGTQTFSILDSTAKQAEMDLPDKLTIVSETQTYGDEGDLDAVVGMCSGSFSQNLVTPHYVSSQMSQSQAIGVDVLALCTGKFYGNQFVSQLEDTTKNDKTSKDVDGNIVEINDKMSHDAAETNNIDNTSDKMTNTTGKPLQDTELENRENAKESHLLKSILDELNDPEFVKPKQYKYFDVENTQNKENKSDIANTQLKKKFIIDSDEEGNEADATEGRKKKFKKRKLEKRALQISDDEEDQSDQDEEEMSEIEDVADAERLVEYDSEENEVVVQPQVLKKKRKVADFFEQEAELTSEDEWAGSGDEDEAGLNRMEREEGDDETFHQGRLQRELGQIHMRDVLDQDKREVRLIQELLLEDGDLGDGHRQRKFRWRNDGDGEEETGAAYTELADTQEVEYESEEQWRKQRHEREMFLKQMHKEEDSSDTLNISISRNSIIKANLSSKSMSTLLMEVNTSRTEQNEKTETVPEKKTARDIPSPKKAFSILKQNYHGSLLTRGRGALARLAALATPLACDDDSPKVGSIAPSSKRNFVFATLTPEAEKPKVTKRKSDTNVGTPKLVKKMKIEEKQKIKTSLLDHLKA